MSSSILAIHDTAWCDVLSHCNVISLGSMFKGIGILPPPPSQCRTLLPLTTLLWKGPPPVCCGRVPHRSAVEGSPTGLLWKGPHRSAVEGSPTGLLWKGPPPPPPLLWNGPPLLWNSPPPPTPTVKLHVPPCCGTPPPPCCGTVPPPSAVVPCLR